MSTAISLSQKGYSVCVLNSDAIPSPLAASTDISKIVRMEYGSDEEYMDMGNQAIQGWKEWNQLLQETVYHETGFLLAARQSFASGQQAFEASSYENLLKKGFQPERLEGSAIPQRFPEFAPEVYRDGFFHATAGYAESARTVLLLAAYARRAGIRIEEGQTVSRIMSRSGRVEAVSTREGNRFAAGHVVICAGNFTPYILPELSPYMQITGHPVFHLKPERAALFSSPHFPVFGADISNTGWYGFPLHPREQVVKIARHSQGIPIHPEKDARRIRQAEEESLKKFLRVSFPSLADAPIVYRRLCCYTDTLDGHFWIDRHPELEGLTVGSGGSGHGFKMGPIIGDMIAAVAEGGMHQWSDRYRWRALSPETVGEEEARYIDSDVQ